VAAFSVGLKKFLIPFLPPSLGAATSSSITSSASSSLLASAGFSSSAFSSWRTSKVI
jgi:hypothetical protein